MIIVRLIRFVSNLFNFPNNNRIKANQYQKSDNLNRKAIPNYSNVVHAHTCILKHCAERKKYDDIMKKCYMRNLQKKI